MFHLFCVYYHLSHYLLTLFEGNPENLHLVKQETQNTILKHSLHNIGTVIKNTKS